MKRLDEIDARLAAATPGPWEHDRDGGGVWTPHRDPVVFNDYRHATSGQPELVIKWQDADLICNAPADLALLSRIARMVAQAACEVLKSGDRDEIRECHEMPIGHVWCLSCRVRRELEAGK